MASGQQAEVIEVSRPNERVVQENDTDTDRTVAEVSKSNRRYDKARKQQKAWAREEAKRRAWFAKEAAKPTPEVVREPQGLLSIPARVDFDDLDMLGALRYVVGVNTDIVHGKIPEDSPTLFLLVSGKKQTMMMFAVDEGLPSDGLQRQRAIKSLGEAIGAARWAEDLSAVFLAAGARMRDFATGEVIKEVLVTGGIRPDGTDAVVALQDVSVGSDGNILLSALETSEVVASPILLVFLDGLHSAINQRKSA